MGANGTECTYHNGARSKCGATPYKVHAEECADAACMGCADPQVAACYGKDEGSDCDNYQRYYLHTRSGSGEVYEYSGGQCWKKNDGLECKDAKRGERSANVDAASKMGVRPLLALLVVKLFL